MAGCVDGCEAWDGEDTKQDRMLMSEGAACKIAAWL